MLSVDDVKEILAIPLLGALVMDGLGAAAEESHDPIVGDGADTEDGSTPTPSVLARVGGTPERSEKP